MVKPELEHGTFTFLRGLMLTDKLLQLMVLNVQLNS